MELIERYLQAIRFWLPRQTKSDIIAEISEDIHAQVDEREASLGRKLNNTEIEEILKQRGAPMLVANSYLPQQSLIGPLLFPFYTFVLKIVALCYLAPWLLVWIGIILLSPAYRIENAGQSFLDSLGTLWGSLWFTTFLSFGVVTVVFAVLERVQPKAIFLGEWTPRKLPPVRDRNQIPRSSSAAGVIVNLLIAAWWSAYMSSPLVFNQIHARITLSSQWGYFFTGFLLLSLGNATLEVGNLIRPNWTSYRASTRLLLDILGTVMLCWLLKSNIVSGMEVINLAPQRAVELTTAINLWMVKVLPVAFLSGGVIAGADIYRIFRVNTVSTAPHYANAPNQHPL